MPTPTCAWARCGRWRAAAIAGRCTACVGKPAAGTRPGDRPPQPAQRPPAAPAPARWSGPPARPGRKPAQRQRSARGSAGPCAPSACRPPAPTAAWRPAAIGAGDLADLQRVAPPSRPWIARAPGLRWSVRDGLSAIRQAGRRWTVSAAGAVARAAGWFRRVLACPLRAPSPRPSPAWRRLRAPYRYRSCATSRAGSRCASRWTRAGPAIPGPPGRCPERLPAACE